MEARLPRFSVGHGLAVPPATDRGTLQAGMSGAIRAGKRGDDGPPQSDVRATNPQASDPGQAQERPVSSAPSSLPKGGDLVGNKYRLRSLIAKGGMATVWLAYNETLDVDVAVKFIRTDLAGPKDDRLADRLLHEAQATAQLGHAAIVRVQDFGKTASGVPFLVMELLQGESLDGALDRRGRIAARKAVRALLPVAHALAVAHDKGIIHRDLKPENIYLTQTPDGRVQPKLIDFGISRINSSGKRLTFIGESLGTPAYMSPEQVYGEETDHRTDIWTFCIVVYEIITGRLPFQGNDITATARAITRDAPTPISEFSAGDEHLWGILSKGLSKQAADRWTSMRELGSELACWLLDRGITEDIAGSSLEATWLTSASSSDNERDAFASLPPPRDSGNGRTFSIPGGPEPASSRRSGQRIDIRGKARVRRSPAPPDSAELVAPGPDSRPTDSSATTLERERRADADAQSSKPEEAMRATPNLAPSSHSPSGQTVASARTDAAPSHGRTSLAAALAIAALLLLGLGVALGLLLGR